MRLLVVELKLKGQMQSETGGVLMGNMQAKVRWEQNDEWAADMWAGRVKNGSVTSRREASDDRPQTLSGCLFHEPQKPHLCIFALNRA